MATEGIVQSDSTMQSQGLSRKIYISEGAYIHNVEQLSNAEVIHVKKDLPDQKKFKKKNIKTKTTSFIHNTPKFKEISYRKHIKQNSESSEFFKLSNGGIIAAIGAGNILTKLKAAIVFLSIFLFVLFVVYKQCLYFSKNFFLKNFLLKQSFSRPPPNIF